MCVRFTQAQPAEQIQAEFGFDHPPFDEHPIVWRPRWNIAPSQDVPAMVHRDGRPAATAFRWGLVPFTTKELKSAGTKYLNARSETVHEKWPYRSPFQAGRRCVVLADGWYEWQGPERIPHWLHLPDRRPFAMAGLWDRWISPEGKEMRSCTILVTDAAPSIRAVHDRMPVILDGDARAAWLDPTAEPEALRSLLAPYADELEAWEVSRLVNNWRNDLPACIERVAQGARGGASR